jgi:ribose-phosphate pyrophosphokinase
MLKGIPTLTCEKVRDCRTGDIVGMDIDDEKLLNTDRVLLVDDICDGGRTFIEVAKLLHVVKEIHLYTTHGIYSKGTEVLRNAGIKRIFNYKGEVV